MKVQVRFTDHPNVEIGYKKGFAANDRFPVKN